MTKNIFVLCLIEKGVLLRGSLKASIFRRLLSIIQSSFFCIPNYLTNLHCQSTRATMDTNIGGSKAVFYAGYTYEDMNRYGFIFSSYSESHPNNLTGEIHPIFQPNNWYNLEFDDVMTPVLRLASNIIKSPNSRMFLYNVYYAERKLLEDLSKRIGREARQFERIRDVPYSEEVFPRTTMLLQRLTDYVRFTWFDPSDPNVSPYQVGYCGKNKHHRAWMSDGYEPTGYISRISLNLNMVRKLSQLRNSPRVCGSSVSKQFPYPPHYNKLVIPTNLYDRLQSQILRLQFMMANSLCHELVHAFNNSITDKMGVPEPFFEDERIAELYVSTPA